MNKIIALVIFVAGSFCSSTTVRAQNFPAIHYAKEDGLPSNTVYFLYRDSKGFIWIATDKGIARYNGIRFEVFTTFNGLPDNIVFSFKEDSRGRVWLGTYTGAPCYYRDGIIHTTDNTPFLKAAQDEPYIKWITTEADSSLIITFNEPFKFMNIDSETCKAIDLKKMKDRSLTMNLVVAKKISPLEYRLICLDKIVTIDTAYNVLDIKPLPAAFQNQERRFTTCQDQDYMFNDSLIYNYNLEVVKRFPKNFHKLFFLHQIFIDGSDTFFATNNGLIVNDTQRVFKGSNISSMTIDDNGNYWVSTLDNGIYLLSKNFRSSKMYTGIYDGLVKYAYSDNRHLFFATSDNNLYSLENDKLICKFNYRNQKHGRYAFALEPIYFIDKKHNYYNLYNNDVVFISNLLSPHPYVQLKTNGDVIWGGLKSIVKTDDYIYIRKRGKIARISAASSDSFVNSTYALIASTSDRMWDMNYSPDNVLWYSTANQMYKMENGHGVLQTQFGSNALKNFCFLGNILIGYTDHNQLIICRDYNSRDVKFNVITEQNCIWDNIYKLDSTHVIISTNNAYRIVTIHPADTSKLYAISTVDDPFIPLQADAICTDSANCYFFKNGCILPVALKALYQPPVPPKLFFTFLTAGKKKYPLSDQLELPYAESKDIHVSFSILSFRGKDVSCQYSFSRTEQDNWTDVSGEEITLVRPGYGTHWLKIRAKTTSGGYGAPITVLLDITKPFWATWWFVFLVSCCCLSLIAVLMRYRIRTALRKREQEHQNEIKFMRSEYKALNALMNPHFIFNTLNNMQSLINKNEKQAANEYLQIFANLVRQNMHNISHELIPLHKEIEIVANYLKLEKFRFKTMLNYSINIGEDVDQHEIMIPPLLIQPLVENSIKHGLLPRKSTDSIVQVDVYEKDNYLAISVRDNGIGINAALLRSNKRHESSGLENIRKRIAQLALMQNKEIELDISETKNDAGELLWTIVTIRMSLS